MPENRTLHQDNLAVKTPPDNVCQIKTNSTSFTILSYFSGDRTYMDIVRSALEREAKSL